MKKLLGIVFVAALLIGGIGFISKDPGTGGLSSKNVAVNDPGTGGLSSKNVAVNDPGTGGLSPLRDPGTGGL